MYFYYYQDQDQIKSQTSLQIVVWFCKLYNKTYNISNVAENLCQIKSIICLKCVCFHQNCRLDCSL